QHPDGRNDVALLITAVLLAYIVISRRGPGGTVGEQLMEVTYRKVSLRRPHRGHREGGRGRSSGGRRARRGGRSGAAHPRAGGPDGRGVSSATGRTGPLPPRLS
ncbi:MAG: hypothetical protein ABR541_00360, partial [Candidatus Dormibacteria bacterium]